MFVLLLEDDIDVFVVEYVLEGVEGGWLYFLFKEVFVVWIM